MSPCRWAGCPAIAAALLVIHTIKAGAGAPEEARAGPVRLASPTKPRQNQRIGELESAAALLGLPWRAERLVVVLINPAIAFLRLARRAAVASIATVSVIVGSYHTATEQRAAGNKQCEKGFHDIIQIGEGDSHEAYRLGKLLIANKGASAAEVSPRSAAKPRHSDSAAACAVTPRASGRAPSRQRGGHACGLTPYLRHRHGRRHRPAPAPADKRTPSVGGSDPSIEDRYCPQQDRGEA